MRATVCFSGAGWLLQPTIYVALNKTAHPDFFFSFFSDSRRHQGICSLGWSFTSFSGFIHSDGFEESVYIAVPARECLSVCDYRCIEPFFPSLPVVKLLTALLLLLSSQNTPGKRWQGHKAAPEISPRAIPFECGVLLEYRSGSGFTGTLQHF